MSASSYDLGFSDGYAEGYACKLADATEPFNPASLDVPDMVERVANHLMRSFAATFPDRNSAIGCAREMVRVAKDPSNG